MQILITGASGDIGHKTCLHLENFSDLNLQATDISPHPISTACPFKNFDLLDIENCREAIDGVDAILHLARLPINPICDCNEKQNLLMTKNLLEASKNAKVKLFVMASSFHVYGCLNHDKVKETDYCNPISNYGKSKKMCEEIVLASSFETNMDVRILRYFNVYGPNMKNGIIPFLRKASNDGLSPKLIYDGNVKRDFIHISDVAEANRLALITPGLNRKIINIGTGKPTSIRDLYLILKPYMKNSKNVYFGEKPDPLGSLFSDTNLAKEILNFQAKRILSDEIPKLFT